MFQSTRNVPLIENFYFDKETGKLNTKLENKALSELCKPTTEFLFKKCLPNNQKYLEFLEGEHVLRFTVDPAIKDNEEKYEEYKANLFNSYDVRTNNDYASFSEAYFDCFFQHYNDCMNANK